MAGKAQSGHDWPVAAARGAAASRPPNAKFELSGLEMIDKTVTRSGKSGRVYLPYEWCGKHVKIIRLD
ncbi:MAG: DUF2080 family transposase-associated protein [Desulfarculus sp.]|nr:DUF2080 family transposase-associated protein [Desulfarculus sp.]